MVNAHEARSSQLEREVVIVPIAPVKRKVRPFDNNAALILRPGDGGVRRLSGIEIASKRGNKRDVSAVIGVQGS